MTETIPSGISIGPPGVLSDEVYQPDQTTFPGPSMPLPVPTISQPDTEMAEPIVRIGPSRAMK